MTFCGHGSLSLRRFRHLGHHAVWGFGGSKPASLARLLGKVTASIPKGMKGMHYVSLQYVDLSAQLGIFVLVVCGRNLDDLLRWVYGGCQWALKQQVVVHHLVWWKQ